MSNVQGGKSATEVAKFGKYSVNIAKLYNQNIEYYQDWLFGCAKAAGELNAKLKIAIVLNNLGLASSCAEPLILQSKSQQTHISRIQLAHIMTHFPHLALILFWRKKQREGLTNMKVSSKILYSYLPNLGTLFLFHAKDKHRKN